MIDADRAVRAFSDVLAVEWDEESGVARIVTVSDCYHAVPDEGMHLCPDREYHDPADGMCKHLVALESIRGNIDAPEGWLVVNDLDERTDPEFDIEAPARVGNNHTLEAFADGGERPEDCQCGPQNTDVTTDLPCWPCFQAGFDSPAGENA